MDTSHLQWKKEESRILYEGKIFNLVSSRHTRLKGSDMDFHLIESPDWVNIIPLTQNNEGKECFVLVRQFRPGAGRIAWEFPGGIVDPGESHYTAAARELQEETGFISGGLSPIGQTNPNPAIMTNTMTTFLARDLIYTARENLDEHEVLDTVLVPVEDILEYKVPDFLVNGIMLIALGWYLKWQNQQIAK